MAARVPPKAMAKKLVRVLPPQHPDYHYLKKVFQHTRELLDVASAPRAKRLPELLTDAETDAELVAFYDAVWHAHQLTHVVMLQLLSGHTAEQNLAAYRELALSDVAEEYEQAMQAFPVR
jgi:hypothetical protein